MSEQEFTTTTTRHILYVEDSDLILRAGMKVLLAAGYEVTGTGSGREAVELVVSDPGINLVLMDIELGEKDIDGTEAARQILAQRDVPVIFLTAYSSKEYVERVREITRYGYVVKNSGDFVLLSSIEMAYQLFDATCRAQEIGQRYQDLYHYAQVGLFEAEYEQGRLITCNQLFCDLLGFESVEKALGRTLIEYYIDPADGEAILDQIQQVGNVSNRVFRIRNLKGRTFWVQLTAHLNPKRNVIEGNLIDVDAQKTAVVEIQHLLEEKELLLREVHHRIKNNMGTIVNLLSLQTGSLADQAAIDALNDAKSRVQSMVVLYDKLCRSEGFDNVAIDEYLGQLVDDISGMFSLPIPVRVSKDIASFVIDNRKLFAIGIIVNELITNCMKYAFNGKTEGEILVSASREGEEALLLIADNGIGLPEDLSPDKKGGFGLRLVETLVRQIDGSFSITSNGVGSRFLIRFPLPKESA